MTNGTPTRPVDSTTIPVPSSAPTSPIARDPGARILKKVYASRPALALRDLGAARA